MTLRRQAACRVGQHHVDAPAFRCTDGVEDNGGGIAARLLDHVDVVPLAPRRKLLARRRAKRIAGGEQNRQIPLLQPFGQLADRCRLARAVDAGEHDHEWARGADFDGRRFQRPHEIGECAAQQVLVVRDGLGLIAAGDHDRLVGAVGEVVKPRLPQQRGVRVAPRRLRLLLEPVEIAEIIDGRRRSGGGSRIRTRRRCGWDCRLRSRFDRRRCRVGSGCGPLRPYAPADEDAAQEDDHRDDGGRHEEKHQLLAIQLNLMEAVIRCLRGQIGPSLAL